ncbi:TRAP transporter small permease [Pseudotabrizicola alkalilacus]|uniref:TRAP transporter small permease protein n=1 Tax=Pseudotabrizicola alkalilacus TaxID=2305252 RepID=A0A411Z2Y8_9RHOB|nr:TRAP transporter small permease [Pseudotabrizicola alkalilacus]RGP37429.1 TRAP transporter small permease [Pseudotabrizicola alkalilacus]
MILLKLYDRIILGLAALGAASLAVVTVLIIYDVLSRNLGWTPLNATSAIVEYALLFSTMAAAPWLVRINGHVSLSSVIKLTPRAVQRGVNRLVLLIAASAVGILAVVSGRIGLRQWQSGTIDMRSVDLSGWLLYAFMALGFALMATEFLRMLLRGEEYTGAGGEH